MFEIVLGQVSECSQNPGGVTRTRKITHSKDEKKGLKSQSAMEYLMTYGWAILIIAIVLVAFFSLNLFNPYTFSPKASPGSCQILRPNGPGSNLFVSAVGPTCTTNEIPQYVAQFNGQSYINSGLITEMPAYTSQFTITVWLRPAASCVGGVYNYCGYFTKQNTTPNRLDTGMVGSVFYFTTYNYVSNVVDQGAFTYQFTPNVWYFVSEVASTSGKTVYINHIRIYNDSFVSNWTTGQIAIVSGRNFNGSLANLQIYNTSLSPSAVNTLYAEGIGGTPVDIQNLVGWWPLNGNPNDYSGNGNNGVPTGVVFTSNWESGYSAP